MAPIPMESGQVESGSSLRFAIEAVVCRGYLGVDREAELRHQIARHRALIDELVDIVEPAIDSVEPIETTRGP